MIGSGPEYFYRIQLSSVGLGITSPETYNITGPFICYINVLLLFKIKLFINKNHCFKYVFTLVETCKQNKNRMRSACAKCENVPNACQGVKIWVQVLKMAKIGTFWAFRIIMSINKSIFWSQKSTLYYQNRFSRPQKCGYTVVFDLCRPFWDQKVPFRAILGHF